jgi:hypothetical protein
MSVDYASVLTHHPDYAGRLWGITDNDYSTLTMHDDGPKPTKKSLEDRWFDISYQLEINRIEAERRARYQAETDGMFFAAQREGGDLTAWQAAVAKIKTDLPYPEEPS